jgi:hypothetical protein
VRKTVREWHVGLNGKHARQLTRKMSHQPTDVVHATAVNVARRCRAIQDTGPPRSNWCGVGRTGPRPSWR